MNFDLNDEQRAFQDSLNTYLARESPLKRALASFDESASTDIAAWKGLMGMGVGGVAVPEEYGGAGLELLDLAVASEAVGRNAMPGPFLEHAVATYAILLCGSEAQKRRWLPALASGEKRATIAWGESGERWLANDWTLPAGERLSGEKTFAPHAEGADLIVVGLAGGGMAVIEGKSSGIEIRAQNALDASRRLYRVTFSNTPAEALPVAASARVCDAALVLLAADAFGGASRCVEMSAAHAKERVQFGVPIGQFQAVKHQLADMALEVEPAIGLYWYAAHAFDHEPERASMAAAMAKAHLSDTYAQVSRRMIELHGGIGYTWEFGAHVWLKRAVFDRTFLGRPEIHRARVADMAGW